VLEVLGLDEDEEAVYRLLLRDGALPTAAITAALGRPAEGTVKSLSAKGLVRGQPVTPAPPAMALGAMLLERQYALQTVQNELSALTDAYRSGPAGRLSQTDVVELLDGPEAIRQHFDQLQRGADRELTALVTTNVAVVPSAENTAEAAAAARGVRYRVICERSLLREPGAEDDLRASLAAGEEVRIAENVPIKMLIADRSSALVPLAPRDGPDPAGALIVHPSGLLDALVALFELAWDRATPLLVDHDRIAPAEKDQVTPLDVRILSLLLAGLTDQTTAAQLGLSVRTVQRRVRHLMDLTGVKTRLQLGWHASRNGWIQS